MDLDITSNPTPKPLCLKNAPNTTDPPFPPKLITEFPTTREVTHSRQASSNYSNTPLYKHPSTSEQLAELLQDVANIMDTITGEKMMCGEELDGEEGQVLGALTELVLIMEQEVEDMIELADIVEEYLEEIELADLEGWVAELTPAGHGSDIDVDSGEEEWEGMKTPKGDGKETIKIRLDEGSKGMIRVGGMLEEVDGDILGWRVRCLDSCGHGDEQEKVSAPVLAQSLRDEDTNMLQENVISVPVRRHDAEEKFRDSALDLRSSVVFRKGSKRKYTAAEDMASSPFCLRRGLSAMKRQWR
ncbi:hypothetical protein CJF31_00001451 [Rutstroemia sp. NJR-2017a BVV2]|nr:hypothetical protein CJF31_00001451 [Rutstroemia sp. NJR-2017a BVV2]